MSTLRTALAVAVLAAGAAAGPARAADGCGSGTPLGIVNTGTFDFDASEHRYTGHVFGITAFHLAAASTLDVRFAVYDGGCALLCDGGAIDACVVSENGWVDVVVWAPVPVPASYVLTAVNLPNPP